MRVVVCGAGIGGLTLAQALRDAADVVVIDRDPDATSTGGYRLALNGAATAVLVQHLDPGLMAQVRAVSDGADRFASFTIADHQLRPLITDAQDRGEDRLLAQRRALRLLLTRGLEDQIVFDATVAKVEQRHGGATVHTVDGTRFDADVVVGAEGPLSPTVQGLTTQITNVPTGLIGIAGSTPQPAVADTPPWLRSGPGLVFDGGGLGMFCSLTSTGSGRLSSDLVAAIGPPALVWGLIAPEKVLDGVDRGDPAALVAATMRVVRRWRPWLLDQIRAVDPDRVAAFTFRAADPKRDLTPWPARRVTAIGDAVHAMPPTGGRAAATAIRDAGCLADQLLRHCHGSISLDAALQTYQQAMPTWAKPALRESLGPVRIIRALSNPALAALARPALALAARLGPAGRND